MAEYVTKEQVIDWYRPYGQTDEPIPFETLVSDLRDMKAADVAPVRHERCEYCKDGKSFSGQRLIFGNDGRWHTIQFCPVCGCKMDGGEQDA